MNIFTRSLDDNLASLVKQVDSKIGENEDKRMAGFVVLLTDEPDEAESRRRPTFPRSSIIGGPGLTAVFGMGTGVAPNL